MTISETLLPEFDQEMANTRKSLERIPEGKLGWKPHTKSYAMGALGMHLAQIPGWIVDTMEKDAFDVAPPGGPPMKTPEAKSRKEILDIFEKGRAAGRAAIAKAPDEVWMQPWSLLSGGKPLFTMPRIAVLRSFVLSHSIHHRAQLGVYLRLNDVPVPAIYGPSADEGSM